MNVDPNIRATDEAMVRTDRLAWDRLHSEREDICEALLKDSQPDAEAQLSGPRTSDEEAVRSAFWHRELLQARLRKIDDALDRIMSGSYGNCSQCGRWIEDTKLEFDPAITYCVECWQRKQTIH